MLIECGISLTSARHNRAGIVIWKGSTSMEHRSRGYRCGLLLGVLTLVIGIVSALDAQDVPPAPTRVIELKSQDVMNESPDAALPPKTMAGTQPNNGPATNILDLDIDQLGKVQAKVPTAFDTEVTTVTAHKSSVGKSPAAVFVVTNEMIRRSGATSVPETLRMVPGLQIAKIGSDKWAISARGFNGEFANKSLVVVDGRTVYSPISAGVYWDTQDLVLQDVERIEVIRGPGATVWGANAVNGVINVITKKSGDTQGALVSSGVGNQDKTINAVRGGGKFGQNTSYRVYAKEFDRAAGYNPQGINDAWNQVRGGFRIDGENPDENDTFTLQGDAYAGMTGETSVLPQAAFPFSATVSETNHVGGGNALGRWTRIVDDENTWSLQTYFDRSLRQDVEFNFRIDTYDVELRQFLKHADTHVFTWGADYRVISDNLNGSRPGVSFNPQSLTWDQASIFGQEEMPFFRDDVKFTVGSKFLYYYFTDFQIQPSARLLWEVDEKQVIWGSVSRAARMPSRGEENVSQLSASPPVLNTVVGGGRSLAAEELLSFELGYRKQVNDKLSFELATFFNEYNNLINVLPIGFIAGIPPIVQSQFQNSQNAQTCGTEINGRWEIHEKWRMQGWYSWINAQISSPGGVPGGTTPRNQAYLMSSWDLPRKFEFDLMARYVDNLPGAGIVTTGNTVTLGPVPSYANLDARLGWRPRDNWEFSIIGQNLLAPHHLEFVGLTTVPSAVNRGVYGQVVWRF